MRSVSAQWEETISESHQLASEITVLTTGKDPPDTEITDRVIEGSVTLDAAASVRGRLELTVADPDRSLLPEDSSDLLTPYGNEIRVRRGIAYRDGTTELVGLGIFRIEAVEIEDAPTGLIYRISGLDRSARIIDARFEFPFEVASGTLVTSTISAVITDADPDVTQDFAVSGATGPKLIAEEQGDRWEFCQRAAAAVGMELYFDGDGVLILRPVPEADAANAVATLSEGAGGILLSAGRSWSREGTFNKVIVTGETSGGTAVPVPRGEASDDDPFSPTFFGGSFGQVPRFYVSEFITSDDQADAAAQALLARELGLPKRVSFTLAPNPALEPSDVIRIVRERSGLDEYHAIENLTIPLTPESEMSGQTRVTT